MKTSRRGLLKLSAQSVVGVSLLNVPLFNEAEAAEAPLPGYTGSTSVAQLVTNADSAHFSILSWGRDRYSYFVRDKNGHQRQIPLSDQMTYKGSPYWLDRIFVDGLVPGETYQLRIFDSFFGHIIDVREFQSLDLNEKKDCRFAVMSCAYDGFKSPAKHMWNCVFRERPDMIFFTGDTVYADFGLKGGEKGIWTRYAEARRRLGLFQQRRLIPTLAIWDDHDFGIDNGDKHFKYKNFSQRVFRTFWGCYDVMGFRRTFGVGHQLHAFGQRFVFMDCRSFRDSRYHWGADQQDDMLTQLARSSEPAWLINGTQFFGNYKNEESFMRDHAKNFVDLTQKLSKIEAPVAFISGDVHFSEISRIEAKILGYKSYEFTSSSIHSFTNPLKEISHKNPRRQRFTWKHNFLVIDSHASEGRLDISTECIGSGQDKIFSHECSIVR